MTVVVLFSWPGGPVGRTCLRATRRAQLRLAHVGLISSCSLGCAPAAGSGSPRTREHRGREGLATSVPQPQHTTRGSVSQGASGSSRRLRLQPAACAGAHRHGCRRGATRPRLGPPREAARRAVGDPPCGRSAGTGFGADCRTRRGSEAGECPPQCRRPQHRLDPCRRGVEVGRDLRGRPGAPVRQAKVEACCAAHRVGEAVQSVLGLLP
jgi:hypothetical protein